jgi:hypothetical protein
LVELEEGSLRRDRMSKDMDGTFCLGDRVAFVTGNGEGLDVQAMRSEVDGVLTVWVDTQKLGAADSGEHAVPKLRVYVNDDPVWENPKFPRT